MKLFPSNALKLLLKYVIKSKTRENRHSRDRQPYYAAAANSNELCHDLMLPDPAPEMRGHRFARSPSHPPQSVATDRQARFNEGETMHGKAVFPRFHPVPVISNQNHVSPTPSVPNRYLPLRYGVVYLSSCVKTKQPELLPTITR